MFSVPRKSFLWCREGVREIQAHYLEAVSLPPDKVDFFAVDKSNTRVAAFPTKYGMIFAFYPETMNSSSVLKRLSSFQSRRLHRKLSYADKVWEREIWRLFPEKPEPILTVRRPNIIALYRKKMFLVHDRKFVKLSHREIEAIALPLQKMGRILHTFVEKTTTFLKQAGYSRTDMSSISIFAMPSLHFVLGEEDEQYHHNLYLGVCSKLHPFAIPSPLLEERVFLATFPKLITALIDVNQYEPEVFQDFRLNIEDPITEEKVSQDFKLNMEDSITEEEMDLFCAMVAYNILPQHRKDILLKQHPALASIKSFQTVLSLL